jgi:hypothetical protein
VSHARGRALAVASAAIPWLFSMWVLVIGLLATGLKCDDACAETGRWQDSPDAWQWNLFAPLGIAAFVAGTAFLVFVARGSRHAAAGAFAALGVLGATVMTDLWSGEAFESGWWTPGGIALAVLPLLAGVIALGLAAPRR